MKKNLLINTDDKTNNYNFINNIYIYLCILAFVFLFMVYWTWSVWADILVDFGRELYVPWQLTKGKLLYKDISYLNGPFSPYFNALIFLVFGVKYSSLVYTNLFIIIILCFLLFTIINKVSDIHTATISVIIFLTLFAFNQYYFYGNYNYVSPYSHELTHGLLFSFLSIYYFFIYLEMSKSKHLILSSFFIGLTFLTKSEIFIACFGANFLPFILHLYSSKKSIRKKIKLFIINLSFILLPIFCCFIVLNTFLPSHKAFVGTIGNFAHIFNDQIPGLFYYKLVLGTDDTVPHLFRSLLGAVFFLGFCISAFLMSLAFKYFQKYKLITSIILSILLIYLLVFFNCSKYINIVINGLPFILLIMIIINGLHIKILLKESKDINPYLCLICLFIFSFLLMLKMILNVRIAHYGFALAMPGTLMLCVIMINILPKVMEIKFEPYGLRIFALIILSFFIFYNLQMNKNIRNIKRNIVTNFIDSFRTDNRGIYIKEVLKQLKIKMKKNDTLAVFPEGVMLNYLLRKDNPTKFYTFMPLEMFIYGEETILDSFKKNSPDFIVLVHKDTISYGFPFFGKHYAVGFSRWIEKNYLRIYLVGAMPLVSLKDFGIAIYKKR